MELEFDQIVLDEYRTLSKGNSGFMKILLEKVRRQLEEYEPLIIADIEERRLQDLREHTHYIKPMMVSLNLVNLLDILETIKSNFQNEQFDEKQINQQIDYIHKAILDIRKQVQAELDIL